MYDDRTVVYVNCTETRSEGAQVVGMFCTDPGQQSTCNGIYLGDEIPGRVFQSQFRIL